MSLITKQYKETLQKLHSTSNWGADGHNWADKVITICQATGATSILDYGCGKGTLKKALQEYHGDPLYKVKNIYEYDPAIIGKDKIHGKADIVVCTDVLEHIEPQFINEVVDHIGNLANIAIYLRIDLRKANTILPDGRNAHLIIQDDKWWKDILSALPIVEFNNRNNKKLEVTCYYERQPDT